MSDKHISDNVVQKHSGEKQLAGVHSAAREAYSPGERGQNHASARHTTDNGLSKGHIEKDGSINFAAHDSHLTRGIGGADKTPHGGSDMAANHKPEASVGQGADHQNATNAADNAANTQKDASRSVTTDADGTRHISQFNKDGTLHGSEVRRPDGSGNAHSVDEKGNTTDATWNKDGSGSVTKKDAKGNPIESSSKASDGARQEDKFDSKGTRTSERFDADGRKTNSEVVSKDGVAINSKYNKDGSVDTNRSQGNRVTDSEHQDGPVSINTHFNEDGTKNMNRFENGKITNSEFKRPDGSSINTAYDKDGGVTNVRDFSAKGELQ